MTFVHLQTAPEAALPYAVLRQGLREDAQISGGWWPCGDLKGGST